MRRKCDKMIVDYVLKRRNLESSHAELVAKAQEVEAAMARGSKKGNPALNVAKAAMHNASGVLGRRLGRKKGS